MVTILRVPKQFNTCADICRTLGLANLTERALSIAQMKKEIQLKDLGTYYEIKLSIDVDLDEIAKLSYFDAFPLVYGQKTDTSKLPIEQTNAFNVVLEVEKRKRYLEYKYQQRIKKIEVQEEIDPPDARTQNGAILIQVSREDKKNPLKHNSLWLDTWNIKNNFGFFLVSIIKAFSKYPESASGYFVKHFQQQTGKKLPTQTSSVKLYFPNAVFGVNRLKADGKNEFSSQKADWLDTWLIAGGIFQYAIAERVKVSEKSFDWRLVVLDPQDITLNEYSKVLNQLRQYDPPSGSHGVAKFDAELSLKFTKELLNYYPVNSSSANTQKRRFVKKSVKDQVKGFKGIHFNSKGQVYGVKDIFSFGLPSWISPQTQAEKITYQKILDEHLWIINHLAQDEGHAELLTVYRDFITTDNLQSFFRFSASYGDYITRSLADREERKPPQFSMQGLEIMVKNTQKTQDWSISEITQNLGFLRIAQAINSATVYAGSIRDAEGKSKETGWERIYGLAQRLSSQSGSKKEFITELTAFLASYENENLRIDDKLQQDGKKRRIWITKEDLDQLIALIDDKRFGCALVANLLIAYGYAKGWGKTADNSPKDATDETLEPLAS
ncbi:hypothetical protein C7H19_10725 [Aphanothece hegewaldii CCALA 016]|uniref:Type I-MYXAN CRISPR-associated protein Cmx8 n=1 Tax=Aphanothece hegewaldii CCALA 016 TaxID=2107694 RepID=A0A2T1LYJ2_9CHRO|nr:hypothetical protein [Aphanothece hegewaldii]PSF37392.1 hypothetical protein C7H19_10725 [Aphanothece hegewaldii CCALA 016]